MVSGCVHSGIINTIKHVQEITESSRVHAVLGGFHLINSDVKRIQATVDELKEIDRNSLDPATAQAKKLSKNLPNFSENAAVPYTLETVWNFR